MCNEDGTVWVTYNGEIYNFLELRADLEKRGHRFKSLTDTEVIVHLYEEMGDECVTRLRGMFAFAVWDERRERLLLARDRVGVKPLYYAKTPNALLFGSELKSLLVDPDVDKGINARAIDRFLTYYYLPGRETLFEGISKLEPGHYLTVEKGQTVVKEYWDLRFQSGSPILTFDEAVEALRVLLRRTVKDHMISDVPVGVLLSGGVDSSGVLSYAVRETDTPIHTFTVGFSGESFDDERPYAKLASDQFGTVHHETSLTAEDFLEFLPKYVWHMEEPVCEPPAVALHFVSRLARDCGVKVLLSGEGGDEAFGGYQTYRTMLMLETLKSAFGPAKGLLRLGLGGLSLAGLKRCRRYLPLIDLPLSEYYLSRTATPNTLFSELKPLLYDAGFATKLGKPASDAPTRKLLETVNHESPLSRMLYVDTKTWLPDDLLVKADKMTMATSVELRVPLLDYQILEFAATLPQQYKVNGWGLKRILKAALRGSVPQEILKRRKTGFPVPYDQWMRLDMREFVRDTLLAKDAASRAYFRRDTVSKLLDFHQKGQGYAKEVFSLLVFELWHQQFLGELQVPQ
jgi:asparagine synthase (glutamine-hydrolysing)